MPAKSLDMSIQGINNQQAPSREEVSSQRQYAARTPSSLRKSYTTSTLSPAPRLNSSSHSFSPEHNAPVRSKHPEALPIDDAYNILVEVETALKEDLFEIFFEKLEQLTPSIQKEILPSLDIDLSHKENSQKILSRIVLLLATLEICHLDLRALFAKAKNGTCDKFEDYMKRPEFQYLHFQLRKGFTIKEGLEIETIYDFFRKVKNRYDFCRELREFKETKMSHLGLTPHIPPSLSTSKFVPKLAPLSYSSLMHSLETLSYQLDHALLNSKKLPEVKKTLLSLPLFAQKYLTKNNISPKQVLEEIHTLQTQSIKDCRYKLYCLRGLLEFLQLDLSQLQKAAAEAQSMEEIKIYLKKSAPLFLEAIYFDLYLNDTFEYINLEKFYNIIKNEPVLTFQELNKIQNEKKEKWNFPELAIYHAQTDTNISPRDSSFPVAKAISILKNLYFSLQDGYLDVSYFLETVKSIPKVLQNDIFKNREQKFTTIAIHDKELMLNICEIMTLLETGCINMLQLRFLALAKNAKQFKDILKSKTSNFYQYLRKQSFCFGEVLGYLDFDSFYEEMQKTTPDIALQFVEWQRQLLNYYDLDLVS